MKSWIRVLKNRDESQKAAAKDSGRNNKNVNGTPLPMLPLAQALKSPAKKTDSKTGLRL
jgi:hypothetical protein